MNREQENQLIESCKARIIKALYNIEKKLTPDEENYISTILRDELRTILTRCATELPITSPDRFRLRANNGSIGGYHPIDGRWYQIYQILDKEGKIRYYTNGVQEVKNLDYSGELEQPSQVD